jgi:hypothetical protein
MRLSAGSSSSNLSPRQRTFPSSSFFTWIPRGSTLGVDSSALTAGVATDVVSTDVYTVDVVVVVKSGSGTGGGGSGLSAKYKAVPTAMTIKVLMTVIIFPNDLVLSQADSYLMHASIGCGRIMYSNTNIILKSQRVVTVLTRLL